MTRNQLLQRKEVLTNQIEAWEKRIVDEKNKGKEKTMFERLNSLRDQLEQINKRLDA